MTTLQDKFDLLRMIASVDDISEMTLYDFFVSQAASGLLASGVEMDTYALVTRAHEVANCLIALRPYDDEDEE